MDEDLLDYDSDVAVISNPIDEARDSLQEIFDYGRTENHSFDDSTVLKILNEHPSLAEERFALKQYKSQNGYGYRWLPLVHLLYAGSELGVLGRVLRLCPNALSFPIFVPGHKMLSPLQMVCYFQSCNVKLVQFIAETFKDAASRQLRESSLALIGYDCLRFSSRCLPLHISMAQHAPIQIIKVLLEVDPWSVNERVERAFMQDLPLDSFSLAHSIYGPGDVLDLVAKAIWKASDKNPRDPLCREYHLNQRDAANLHNTGQLETLLGHLRRWHFAYENMATSNETLNQFLGCLHHNKTIKSLNLAFGGIPDFIHGGSLEKCLQCNSGLTKLVLDLGWCANGDAMLQHISQGTSSNSTLESLTVRCVVLDDISALQELLSSPSRVREVNLSEVVVRNAEAGKDRLDASESAEEEALSIKASPPIQSLSLRLINLQPGTELVPCFSNLPCLTSLSLHNVTWIEGDLGFETDDTSLLLGILAHRTLRELTIESSRVDMCMVYKALEDNATLTSFCCNAILPNHEKLILDLLEKRTSPWRI